MKTWLSTSLQRHYPASCSPQTPKTFIIPAARGERLSFQACYFNDDPQGCVEISARVLSADELGVTIRRVGHVPVPHRTGGSPKDELDGWDFLPGYVPDPLFPETAAIAGPEETGTFWITVDVPRNIQPGKKEITIELMGKEKKAERKSILKAVFSVSGIILQKRRNFRVSHWFYADAIANWYKLPLWGKEFWPMCEKYMRNFLAHGNDIMHTPIFTPPTDQAKYPCQLLIVRQPRKGQYTFDFRRVKQWVDLARKCGADYFSWSHFFPPRGGFTASMIYETKDGKEIPLWSSELDGTSDTYRNFLKQLMPHYKRFLQRENLLDISYFHISDEPYGPVCLEQYKKSSGMIRELAPWIRTLDAVSEIEYARENLTDFPIPCISHIKPFLENSIHPCFSYFCCAPRGRFINRFLDTPLLKVRMLGWVLYRTGLDGFLHWGYNFWDQFGTREMIDPFTVTDGKLWPMISYGDPFVVYPGPDGPIDSIRWEIFAEGLQDYALLETLGVMRDSKLLAPVRDFEEFPRDGKWFDATRRKLLAER